MILVSLVVSGHHRDIRYFAICLYGAGRERSFELLDRHPVPVVGIDKARPDDAIGANHERRRDWKQPGIVVLIARKIHSISFHRLA
jgi:hypothetical protein